MMQTYELSATPDLKDLIFCPLDLPPVPQVDTERFLAWMEEAQAHKRELGQFTSAEKSGNEGLGDYPWFAAYALSPVTANRRQPWVAGFEKQFPELVDYCKRYPFQRLQTVHFIAQKEGREVFLHTDRDRWWGMRFYLQNDNGEKLYFRRMFKRLDERPLTWVRNPVTGRLEMNDWETLCRKEKIYARLPESRCPFMIGSVRAAHAVERTANPMGSKITALLVGEYDPSRLQDLLRRSVDRFPSYCVWY